MASTTHVNPRNHPATGRHRRWRLPLLLIAGVATVLGAAPLAAAKSIFDRDGVQLTSAGFDFGDDTFEDGAPTGNGTLNWVLENGQVTPKLQGTLHLKNVSTCARMRMHYLNGTALLTTREGGRVCAPDNAHHAWSVNLSPYSDIAITSVIVSIESQDVAGNWQAVDSDTYWRNTTDDQVIIRGSGIDFGASGFANDEPAGPATVDWSIENGVLVADVSGTVHLDRSAGACVRIRLEPHRGNPHGEAGQMLWPGPATQPICAADNSYLSDAVELSYPLFPAPIGGEVVRVVLESLTGAGWQEVGSQFAYVSEDF
jgi:hypothetical protein